MRVSEHLPDGGRAVGVGPVGGSLWALLLLVGTLFPQALAGSTHGKVSGIAGPWWTYPIRQVQCPSSLIFKTFSANFTPLNTPKSANELQRVNCVVDMGVPLSDAQRGIVTFDSYTNNRWKENAIAPIKVPRGLCSFFRGFLPDFYSKLFGLPATGKGSCSIPSKHYEILDTPVNWTYPTMPYFFYGHFRFRMVAGTATEDQICFGIEFKVFRK